MLGEGRPNKRDGGGGGMTVLLHAGRPWPALPDRDRSAVQTIHRMLCDLCNKREATVHLTQTVPREPEVKKRHLCEVCFAETGLDDPMKLATLFRPIADEPPDHGRAQ